MFKFRRVKSSTLAPHEADATVICGDGTELAVNTRFLSPSFAIFETLLDFEGVRRVPIPGRPAMVLWFLELAMITTPKELEGWIVQSAAEDGFDDVLLDFLRLADLLQWRSLESFLMRRAEALGSSKVALFHVMDTARLECSERVQNRCLELITHARIFRRGASHPIAPIRTAMAAYTEGDLLKRLDHLTDIMAPFAKVGAPLLPGAVARALCTGQPVDVDFVGASLPSHAIALGPFDQQGREECKSATFDHMGHTWRFGVSMTPLDDDYYGYFYAVDPVLELVRLRDGAEDVTASFMFMRRIFSSRAPPHFIEGPWGSQYASLNEPHNTRANTETHRFFDQDDGRLFRCQALIHSTPGTLFRGSDPFGSLFTWVKFIECT